MHTTTPSIKALLSGSLHWFGNLEWFCFVSVCFWVFCQAPGSSPSSSSQALHSHHFCLSVYFSCMPCSQAGVTATAPQPVQLGRACPPRSLLSLGVASSAALPLLLNSLWLLQLTTLKQMNRHIHRKDKLNFYSRHNISYNKAMPFYHRVAACSSVLSTDRKQR